ncbi:hypothetical protein ES703_88349 [subsurface metagenome]
MDAETFDMVDGLLATQGETDDRESAISLMEVGVREGTLYDVAKVISERYAFRPHTVIEWYAEVLNRRVQAATAIIEKLKELTEGNVGSQ